MSKRTFAGRAWKARTFTSRTWAGPAAAPAGETNMALSTKSQQCLVQALGDQGVALELVTILNSGGLLPGSPPFGSAWTQTYSTASHTVADVTTHAITDSSGGTASTTALAAQGVATTATDGTTPSAACTKTSVDALLVIIRNAISTLAAELALLKADVLADKKALTGLIDDLQLGGIIT